VIFYFRYTVCLFIVLLVNSIACAKPIFKRLLLLLFFANKFSMGCFQVDRGQCSIETYQTKDFSGECRIIGGVPACVAAVPGWVFVPFSTYLCFCWCVLPNSCFFRHFVDDWGKLQTKFYHYRCPRPSIARRSSSQRPHARQHWTARNVKKSFLNASETWWTLAHSFQSAK